MKKQPFVNFVLAGVNLTSFGFTVPAPFCSLQLNNSQIDSYTSWTLRVVVGGDSSKRINVASFEALLYSAAQEADKYDGSSGIPVQFAFGWLDDNGNVSDYMTYRGWTLQFKVSTNNQFLSYELTGYASLAMQMSMPVIHIPAVTGFVQPSAVLSGLIKGLRADTYYDVDIDHNDNPVYFSHEAMTTSFTNYVRGTRTTEDNYEDFPGLLRLSTSYNSTRSAAGIKGLRKLSQGINNLRVTNISHYLKGSFTDNTVQASTFSYWVDEPTMTQPGCIHYKSNAGLSNIISKNTLEYGTANTNIISINGSYNGVAYNMTNMNFSSLGFSVDGSGQTILKDATVVNSWSNSLSSVYQSSSIINDVNAIASQFSGNFNIQIPGSISAYTLAQPVSLIVMSGNTLSPITGIYNVMSVSHDLSNTFVTTLKVQRLVMSSANQTALTQGITIANRSTTGGSYIKSYHPTPNVKSPGKVDFGNTIYPDFETLVANSKVMMI